MNLDALWHDLECGDYEEDLPVWRALADEAGGPVLEIGAGTGRVTLDLAARGVSVVALDNDAALLDALRHRAAGLPVQTVVADARDFALGRRFSLVIVPMQTLQLLGGAHGREAFLRCALDHVEPGGRLAAALADAMDCFDEEHPLPPPPAARHIVDVRYASQLLAVVEDDGRAAMHRRREIIGPGDRYACRDVTLRLDRVTADEAAAEAARVGFLDEPHRFVPESDEYLGTTVVVQRAPPHPSAWLRAGPGLDPDSSGDRRYRRCSWSRLLRARFSDARRASLHSTLVAPVGVPGAHRTRGGVTPEREPPPRRGP